MKTPEEIMKGLGCMSNSDIECSECPYRDDNYLFCSTGIVKDAIACIQQLEADNKILEIKKEAAFAKCEQLEHERDAVVYDMQSYQGAVCAYCKNLYRPEGAEHTACREFGYDKFYPLICRKFKWRGPCEENGGKG